MHKLKSLDKFYIAERDATSLIVQSPVTAPRERAAYRVALGPIVEIDGVEHEPIGFEWNVPNTPVRVGENIGIVVRGKH